MVVSLPPMIMGLAVESSSEPLVLALYDDLVGVCPAVSSPARAPATRLSAGQPDQRQRAAPRHCLTGGGPGRCPAQSPLPGVGVVF